MAFALSDEDERAHVSESITYLLTISVYKIGPTDVAVFVLVASAVVCSSSLRLWRNLRVISAMMSSVEVVDFFDEHVRELETAAEPVVISFYTSGKTKQNKTKQNK